jgi:hypothetical protein
VDRKIVHYASDSSEELKTIEVETMSTVSHYLHLTIDLDGTARIDGVILPLL